MKILRVLFLNEAEAEALGEGTLDPETMCRQLGEHCELTVLTLGSQGLWTCMAGSCEFHAVHPLDEVVDSTGAGDFFAGGFLSAWLQQEKKSECIAWGVEAAQRVLQVFGTDLKEGWLQLRELCRKADGKSFLDIELEFKDGVLRATKTGALPEAVAVSAEIERVEIFGLQTALSSAESVQNGKAIALPRPRSRLLDGEAKLQAAVVKVKPFIDMRSEWQLSVK
ncbi:Adenosine kinase 2 (AK 2) (Adenosine 5'-phosphotransferase 2) [Durusdinium trenchii]|uniref:Adenosine kinase 2 (AK 2) (Adenosine 5'-phosphotransferase 2) n=1 Tax=Durusdinium trenchii TaxID=1381693 RepID=A0ABP0RBB8_9DINO